MTVTVEDNMTDMNEEHVEVWKDKYAKILSMWNTEATDTSIMLPIIQHFWTVCVEQGKMHEMISAVQYAINTTGDEPQDIIDRLNELGFALDIDAFQREYEVTVTIPVSLTFMIQGMNEDDAQDKVIEYIDNHGVEKFSLDYDSYDATIDSIYEV